MIEGVILMLSTMTGKPELDFSTLILPKTDYVMNIVIGQLDDFFSQSLIVLSSQKSHPLEIVLVLVISGLSFGILEPIVALPAKTVLRVILKEFFYGNKCAEVLTKGI